MDYEGSSLSQEFPHSLQLQAASFRMRCLLHTERRITALVPDVFFGVFHVQETANGFDLDESSQDSGDVVRLSLQTFW